MKKNIILGGGCFWCTEAIFTKTKGVEKVLPGYIGGKTLNPTYKDICTGITGHAEVISCLLYTSPSPRDTRSSRMPSSA